MIDKDYISQGDWPEDQAAAVALGAGQGRAGQGVLCRSAFEPRYQDATVLVA